MGRLIFKMFVRWIHLFVYLKIKEIFADLKKVSIEYETVNEHESHITPLQS